MTGQRFFLWVLAAVLPMLVPTHAQAARHALVIGNEHYRNLAPFPKAAADARLVAKALEGAGFAVTLQIDAGSADLQAAAKLFAKGISAGDDALLYFVGHRVTIDSLHQLLPADVQTTTEAQAATEALSLESLLHQLGLRRASFFVALIDAGAGNPFAAAGRKIGHDFSGEPRLQIGQLAMFSTRDLARQADDAKGPNGLFARSLATAIESNRNPIGRALQMVAAEMEQAVRGKSPSQTLRISDRLEGDYFFHVATSDIGTADIPPGEITKFIFEDDVGPAHRAVVEVGPSAASCTAQRIWDVISKRRYEPPPALFGELKALAADGASADCNTRELSGCTGGRSTSLVAMSRDQPLFRRDLYLCGRESTGGPACQALLGKVRRKVVDLKCDFNRPAQARPGAVD